MFLSHRPNHNAKYKGRRPSEERIVHLNGRYIGDISKDIPRDDPRGSVYLWRWRACTFPEKYGVAETLEGALRAFRAHVESMVRDGRVMVSGSYPDIDVRVSSIVPTKLDQLTGMCVVLWCDQGHSTTLAVKEIRSLQNAPTDLRQLVMRGRCQKCKVQGRAGEAVAVRIVWREPK